MAQFCITEAEEKEAEENALAWLIESNLVSREDIEQASKLGRSRDKSILLTLNQMGVLDDPRLADTFARVTGLDVAPPPEVEALEDLPILNSDFMQSTQSLLLTRAGPLY